MAIGSAWILPVEFSVNDSVECHRASPGANHCGQNERKNSPTGPAAIFPCGNDHGSEGKGQRENCVGQFYESGPFFNLRKHRTSNIGY